MRVGVDDVIRTPLVAITAAGLVVCTNGPTVYAATAWLHQPLTYSSSSWYIPFGLVALLGIVLLGRHLADDDRGPIPWVLAVVVAYAAWTLVSSIWSVAPRATVVNGLVGFGVVAFGSWIGWALRFAEQAWAIAIAMTLCSAVSVFVVFAQRDVGRMPVPYVGAGGEWRGIFGNRNSLAPVTMLGLVGVVCVVALRPSVKRICIGAVIASLHMITMIGARSTTSFFALALGALIAAAAPVVTRLRRHAVGGLVVSALSAAAAVLVGVFLLLNISAISTRIGRDPTLSGRRLIWDDVLERAARRPAGGYGFAAFWEREDLTAPLYEHLGGAYGSAHNSMLEVLLGLGVPGLAAYVLLAGAAIFGCLAWAWRAPSIASWGWVAIITLLTALNAMESFVLWHSYVWVLTVASAFAAWTGIRAANGSNSEIDATDIARI